MKTIDLHSHTTASDGTLTPTQLAAHAKEMGVSAVAVTDHDTIDGLAEAREAGERYGVEIINGIEFSVGNDIDIHLVGLDFTDDCPSIVRELEGFVEYRDGRNRKIIDKLNSAGVNISYDDALSYATSRVVGRSQMARAMIDAGYVKTIDEAFDRYLSPGAPGYVPRECISPERAIDLIHSSKGFASLAHLNQIKMDDDDKFAFLKHLADLGLDACEGYYTEYTEKQGALYRSWANKLGLKLTGGSDFHGANKEGHELGNVRIPYSVLEELRSHKK